MWNSISIPNSFIDFEVLKWVSNGDRQSSTFEAPNNNAKTHVGPGIGLLNPLQAVQEPQEGRGRAAEGVPQRGLDERGHDGLPVCNRVPHAAPG